MKRSRIQRKEVLTLAVAVVLGVTWTAQAMIPAVSGPVFNLTAREGYIQTPDGGSYYMWGYANGAGIMQYPGPTLEVQQGDIVEVNLRSELEVPVSIVFPGQVGVTATGGQAGLLTREAPANNDGVVQYTFEATHAGTYLYHSGTNAELQVEMGLVGALIVRPQGVPAGEKWAYNHADSAYDHEYLFLFTELDPVIHEQAQLGLWDQIDFTQYWPVNWFINGRCAPDVMLPAHYPLLPTQPYNCMPRMHPGDRLLMRCIGAGRDLHPFHTHGNNFLQIARDGRLLSSDPTLGANLAMSDFTLLTAPGETADAIFTWTGEKLGWDIYGHAPEDPLEPGEYAPDHGKPFPVNLPDKKDLTFGATYSGSPFLGAMGTLPPGEGGFNIYGGYFYMWHSHNEKEMVNNDIFPGGLMTMCIVEPPGTPIDMMMP